MAESGLPGSPQPLVELGPTKTRGTLTLDSGKTLYVVAIGTSATADGAAELLLVIGADGCPRDRAHGEARRGIIGLELHVTHLGPPGAAPV